MTSLIIIVAIAVGLWGVMFLSRRRYGVATLTLAAGAILSQLWIGKLTPLIASTGVHSVQPPLESIVAFVALLVPSLLVLFGGAKQHSTWARVVGGIVFSLVAVALLHDILQASLVINGLGVAVFAAIAHYKTVIVTFGLLLAIGDAMTIKSPKRHVGH